MKYIDKTQDGMSPVHISDTRNENLEVKGNQETQNTAPMKSAPEVQSHMKHASSPKLSTDITVTRSTGLQTASRVNKNRQRRMAATDPGNWPLKPSRPILPRPSGALESQHQPSELALDGAGSGRDPLEMLSRQEESESLAALAYALTDNKISGSSPRAANPMSIIKKRLKRSSPICSNASTTSGSPKASESSPGSPMRFLKAFGSQKNRHTEKVSSTAESSANADSEPHSTTLSVMESQSTTPCSDIFDISRPLSRMLPFSTPSPVKILGQQSPIPRVGPSPFGTVRALAAKFDSVDLVNSPIPALRAVASKASLPSSRVHSTSPEKAVIAAYTINEASPAKSQKSDKPATNQTMPEAVMSAVLEGIDENQIPLARKLTPYFSFSSASDYVNAIGPSVKGSPRSPLHVASKPSPTRMSSSKVIIGYDPDGVRSALYRGTCSPIQKVGRVEFDNSAGASDQEDTIAPKPLRNSGLITKVQGLRQDLAARTEEIQQLQQKLNMWRTRAQVAEKQVQLLTEPPIKTAAVFHQRANISDRPNRRASTSKSSDPKASDNTRYWSHGGFDGASSTCRVVSANSTASEESSTTIIRSSHWEDGNEGL
ncbi:hypothetical protein BJ878DRAFT_313531 [Calycina marina]|uniref:Uncharacterized protein n=1 Tax=Calycina marina TaxID=1763456 RepID=A0A9P7Z656_9HELO|nr:hypothetical protein BJ878DRAFT_313531 [Calycina marina]